MKHMLQVKSKVQMKAHSSKYLTAAHSSMALVTTDLQGLLPHSADGCTYHVSGKVSQEEYLYYGNRKASTNSQLYPQLTKPYYFKQNCKTKASILQCQNEQAFPFSPEVTIYNIASLPHP